MLSFTLFTILYPLNLYIFQWSSTRFSRTTPLYSKVLSILVSCVIIYMLTPQLQFNWHLDWSFLLWILVAIAPFILPLAVQGEACEDPFFIQLRDYLIAPLCEEFYYRMALPKHLHASSLLNAFAFSVAHAHPLFAQNSVEREETKIILAQAAIAFAFGFVCNGLKQKLPADSLFTWLALALLHGLANRCGIPLIIGKGPPLFFIQLSIILLSLYLIFK